MVRQLILHSICFGLLLLAVGLPVILVKRFRGKGVACGTFVTWVFLFMALLGEVANSEEDTPVAGLGLKPFRKSSATQLHHCAFRALRSGFTSIMLLVIATTASAMAGISFTLEGQWPGYRRRGVNGISLSGHYAYLAQGEAGLGIFDVFNPDNPMRVGAYDTGDSPSRFAGSTQTEPVRIPQAPEHRRTPRPRGSSRHACQQTHRKSGRAAFQRSPTIPVGKRWAAVERRPPQRNNQKSESQHNLSN